MLYVKCALTIAVLYGVVKCSVVRCMYHVLLSIDHSCEEKSITKMKLCLFGVRCLCVCVLGKNLDRERESFKKCMIKCTDWLWVIEYEWLSVHWFGPTSCTTLSSAQTPRPLDTYTHNPIHSIPPDCHPVRKQIMCSHICYYRWKCLNMHAFNDVYLFALQIINTERGGGAALYNEHVSYQNIRCVFAVKHIHAPVFDMCLYIYGIHVFRVGKKTQTMYSYFVDMLFGWVIMGHECECVCHQFILCWKSTFSLLISVNFMKSMQKNVNYHTNWVRLKLWWHIL